MAQARRALRRTEVHPLHAGRATGVDLAAKEWARKTPGLERYECKADWDRLGPAAGPIRNSRMLEWKPDLVIAFPGQRA